MNHKKDVIVLTGAGQLGMAIVRTLAEAGFDVVLFKVDISSKESVTELIDAAQKEGEIGMFINAAGVSPSQASIEQILKVDLYGTSILLEEFEKVIKVGGTGVVISGQSGYRMPALSTEEDKQLAKTPTEELLQLEMLKPENIKDNLYAYQIANRCNGKMVMAEAVKWGERGARVNAISPGIIITPLALALDEINGPRREFYKNKFTKSPAGRPGIADEVANVAELLLSNARAFISGSDFLIDGGATASYYYGPLQPKQTKPEMSIFAKLHYGYVIVFCCCPIIGINIGLVVNDQNPQYGIIASVGFGMIGFLLLLFGKSGIVVITAGGFGYLADFLEFKSILKTGIVSLTVSGILGLYAIYKSNNLIKI